MISVSRMAGFSQPIRQTIHQQKKKRGAISSDVVCPSVSIDALLFLAPCHGCLRVFRTGRKADTAWVERRRGIEGRPRDRRCGVAWWDDFVVCVCVLLSTPLYHSVSPFLPLYDRRPLPCFAWPNYNTRERHHIFGPLCRSGVCVRPGLGGCFGCFLVSACLPACLFTRCA